MLGLDELAADERFLHNEDRTRNRELLRPHLVGKLKERGADEWFAVLTAAGLPCGPINTVQGGVEFAEKIGLAPVVEVGEGAAMVPSIRNPISFSATPSRHELPPPGIGEHSDEIRAWLNSPRES